MNIADMWKRRHGFNGNFLDDDDLMELLRDTESVCASLRARGVYYAMATDALASECKSLRAYAEARGLNP